MVMTPALAPRPGRPAGKFPAAAETDGLPEMNGIRAITVLTFTHKRRAPYSVTNILRPANTSTTASRRLIMGPARRWLPYPDPT